MAAWTDVLQQVVCMCDSRRAMQWRGCACRYDHDEAWAANMELFKQFTDESQGVRRLGAAAVDMCHVAMGVVDAYWEYRLKPWDVAAGVRLLNVHLTAWSCTRQTSLSWLLGWVNEQYETTIRTDMVRVPVMSGIVASVSHSWVMMAGIAIWPCFNMQEQLSAGLL